jgi:hypothetical protein
MKPQQQTISVRVSDGLRRRVEHAKQIVANATGELVSISDVARRFLEAAQDESVEAAELLAQPTETLLNIQRKWERHHGLSRPEWIVLGYYVQVGCEAVSEDPRLPTAESYASLFEAFLAARALRVGKNLDRDRYYLSNLPQANGDNGSGRADLQAVPKVARAFIRRLRQSPSSVPKLVFGGRNLYVALRDERLKGVEVLNQALAPHLPVLFRLAARGHWLREGRSVRSKRGPLALNGEFPSQFPPVVVGDYRLSIAFEVNELSLLIDFGPRRILYPLSPYPMISEFAAMLIELKLGNFWDGRQFFAYTSEKAATFAFRQRANGISIVFSPSEWRALAELMAKALALPEVQPALEDLALAYGEI